MRSERFRLGGIAVGSLVIVLALLYAPLVQLIVSSVNANSLTTRWEGFTTRWYRAAFADDVVTTAMWRSLRLAVLVAVTSGLVGTSAAIAVRHRPRMRALVRGLATARVATPEIVLAVALGVLFPLLGVRFGSWTMWFGHSALLSAYVVLIVAARLAGQSPNLEDAAADLGARPFAVVRHVVLPHAAPAVGVATLLVAAFSFDDVLLSSRLSGPQDTTLPLVIVSMATRRTTPELDAIGSLVIAAGLSAFAVAALIGRVARSRERGEGLPL